MTSTEKNTIAVQHQKAFRAAFDFLSYHYPPGNSPEWWEQAVKNIDAISDLLEGNPLAVKLMVAVFDYLDEERKLVYADQ